MNNIQQKLFLRPQIYNRIKTQSKPNIKQLSSSKNSNEMWVSGIRFQMDQNKKIMIDKVKQMVNPAKAIKFYIKHRNIRVHKQKYNKINQESSDNKAIQRLKKLFQEKFIQNQLTSSAKTAEKSKLLNNTNRSNLVKIVTSDLFYSTRFNILNYDQSFSCDAKKIESANKTSYKPKTPKSIHRHKLPTKTQYNIRWVDNLQPWDTE